MPTPIVCFCQSIEPVYGIRVVSHNNNQEHPLRSHKTTQVVAKSYFCQVGTLKKAMNFCCVTLRGWLVSTLHLVLMDAHKYTRATPKVKPSLTFTSLRKDSQLLQGPHTYCGFGSAGVCHKYYVSTNAGRVETSLCVAYVVCCSAFNGPQIPSQRSRERVPS